MFVGRAVELSRFEREFAAPRPSLLIVSGRRRIGKSALLRQAIKGRPHVLYQATRMSASLNLDGLKAEIARSLGGDDILGGLADWLGVLAYLARRAETMPGLVVGLDEFPYLVDADPALPSVVQTFWDGLGPAAAGFNLVLCGSMIAQMEALLAERNPLHGRYTLAMNVQALPLRDVAAFLPDRSADDVVLIDGIFGGVPFYLRLCDGNISVRENVIALLLSDAGALVDEPNVLLQSELRETQRYGSILAAVADGCTKVGEIAGWLRDVKDSTALGPYLARLERMRMLRALRSMDAEPKSRDRRFFIDDPLIAFWHRFVRPNLSSVAAGFGADIWRHQVAPHLDAYMGGAFEAICRAHAMSFAQERWSAPAQEIGQVWGADHDIDVAGRLLDGTMLYGQCKWRRGKVGEEVLDHLIARAERTAYGRGADRRFALYARSGFTKGLVERASRDGRIGLYTPAEMVGWGG